MDEDTGGPNHGYFQTPQGKLHYREYLPDTGDIKAVCVWQHGIQANSGTCVKLTNVNPDGSTSISYTNIGLMSRKLKSNQIALYALDMLGHGFSEGTRFYIPKGDYKINRDAFESFARFVSDKHQGFPLFLMGDSYGGCLALHTARLWQDASDHPVPDFKGVCLNAPAIVGDLPPLPITLFLRHVVAPLFPKATPFFMPHPIHPERIWRDPEVLKGMTSNEVLELKLSAGAVPFCLGTASGLVKSLEDVQSSVIPGFNVPFSVCHGTHDFGVKLEGTEFLVKNCATKEEDREVRIADGALHDLMSDPTRVENLDFHISFILSRIEK